MSASWRIFVWLRLSWIMATIRSAHSDETDLPEYLSLTPVQSTSIYVALYRHLETLRDSGPHKAPSPPLLQDPFASILLTANTLGSDESIETWKQLAIHSFMVDLLAVRTRVVDDWMQEGMPEGPRRQIVNLGAGMCTRPYRLDRLDQHTTQAYFEVESDSRLLDLKYEALAGHQPYVKPIPVHSNVSDPELYEQLLQAGFDPSTRTDFIAEGIMEYLTLEEQRTLLKTTARLAAPGSRLLVWNVDPWANDWTAMMGVSFPHPGYQKVEDMVKGLQTTEWSHNITIVDDDLSWERYGRAINLPWYICLAEYSTIEEHEL